ncbi:MAG TPA: hypothetical protein VG095_02960 [Chthoniobacterales bacterium]|nr:hypothetical protein [Chthoniobacterales bacterium]
MKAQAKKVRRQIFVFTIQEKKAAAFLVAAFLLGVTVKHYRDTHPAPPPRLSERQKYQQQRAEKRAKAYARSARGQEEAARNAAAARHEPFASPSPFTQSDAEE